MNSMVNLISVHMNIFTLFSKVYIFGSIISNKHPNDIDLLLIYESYSEIIQTDKNTISIFLEKLSKLPIDITILSEEELTETKFLDKIGSAYIRLK